MAKSIAKSIKRAVAAAVQEETTVVKPKQLNLAFVTSPCQAGSNSIPQIAKEAAMG